MAKFKIGDKVIPSKQMREQCEVSEWFERVKDKVKDDGYMVISQVYGSGTYIAEGLSSIVFIDEWLEPYIDQTLIPMPKEVWLPKEEVSVRDRFAIAALKGLLSSGKDCVITEPSSFARVVYSIADAMMEARKI